MKPHETSRPHSRNEDDFHTQALRTSDPTDPFVRFATTDPELEPPTPVGQGPVRVPARSRTGLVVIVAFLIEFVAIVGGANQWVADRIRDHTNLVSTPDLFARSMLTYSWRFSPPGGHDTGHAWSAQLLSVVAFLVLSALLIVPAVGRHVTFFRAFFGVWGAVVLATALARMVVPAVQSSSASGGAGVSRLSRVLFASSDSRTVAASIALGFVVALIAAAVAVVARRRPAVAVAAAVVVPPESPLPTAPPPFYGPETGSGDPAFDPRGAGAYGSFDEHGYPSGYGDGAQQTTPYGAPGGFGDAEFSQPRYTASGETNTEPEADRTAAIPVVGDGPEDVASTAEGAHPADAASPTDVPPTRRPEPTARANPTPAEQTAGADATSPEVAEPPVLERTAGPDDTRQFPVVTDAAPEPVTTTESERGESERGESAPTEFPVVPALTPEEREALVNPPRPEPTRNWDQRTPSTPAEQTDPPAEPAATDSPGAERAEGESAAGESHPDATAVFPKPVEPDHDGMDDEELPPR